MNDNEEANKSKGGAIGAVIGTLVLAAACAVGGWIANDLWPKKEAEKPQMPQMVTTVAVKEVEERIYNLPEKFVAHAEAMQEVDLLPQVDGYIKEIKFKEGDSEPAQGRPRGRRGGGASRRALLGAHAEGRRARHHSEGAR